MSGTVAGCLQQLASLRDRLDRAGTGAGAGDIGQLFGRLGDTGADQDQQLCDGKIGRKMLGYVHFVKLQ